MLLKNCIKEFGNYLGSKECLLDKNFPRIAEKFILHWGYPEFYQYINKLLVVDKDRNRQGFGLDALKEIYALQMIHEKLFPEMKMVNINDVQNWSQERTKRSLIS